MTDVGIADNCLVQYERRFFLGVIHWWVQIKVESQGKDLVINTTEHYNRIFLNGEEIK